MPYNVKLTKRTEKEFLSFSHGIQKQLTKTIDQLETDPFATDIRKLKTPLAGYRIRTGNYRILLVIEKKDITIYSIKNRKDAYKL